MEPEELTDFYPPLISHKEWVRITRAKPLVVWTHVSFSFEAIKIEGQNYTDILYWLKENATGRVYDSTLTDYYFEEPKDALLFKLWLQTDG